MSIRNGAILGFAAITAVVMAACSDSPTNSDQAAVTMQAEIASPVVTSTATKQTAIAGGGATVDSLRVTRVRILVSELKLHRDKEDDINGDHNVKVGPMMLQADASGARVFATGAIPPGSYDKIKFEFHRFSTNEVAQYLADSVFADFVTDQRSTVVIDGIAYVDGRAWPFTYKSDVTANLTLKFESVVALSTSGANTIVIVVDPALIFKSSGRCMDPRDSGNHGSIDNYLRNAIKVIKRLS